MKKIIGVVAVLAVAAGCCCRCENDGAAAKAMSPDGKNVIRLWTEPLAYSVSRCGKTVVAKTEIGFKLNGECVAKSALKGVSRQRISGKAKAQVYKKSEVSLAANETVADFGDWEVRLAARNDGVAYRFVVKGEGEKIIDCEKADLTIPARARCAFNRTTASGQEETLPEFADAAKLPVEDNKLVYLPFVYTVDGVTVAVTEADLHNYPIWNLKASAAEGETVKLTSKFDKHPDKVYHQLVTDWNKPAAKVDKGGRFVKVDTRFDYLTKSEGGRALPWRVFVIADKPARLIDADIVWALATPATGDFSWVKPGKVAWDWWNAWDNKGGAGCNTAMYKRFIDFAAQNGVEYVILDEGWSETLNIWKFHPNVDVPEIIRYGKEKGVGIVLWMAWAQVYGDEAKVAEHFGNLGAVGFKVDFMDRGDAQSAAFKEKFAAECAKRKLLVDYHGAFRPTGLSRTYPNILNYEGIHGLEQMKWYHSSRDMMANDVAAAFLRMTAGPMDYTPGAMDNYPIGGYKGNGRNPGSLGTRCRQMAMMALYEAPLQMLSDAPTKYEKNIECFSFMSETPVVWDNSLGLDGDPESFVVAARRKGAVWYAAGMTNKEARDYTLDTTFLGGGKWNAEIFRDTEKGATEPMTYHHEKKVVKSGEKINLPMAPGGGFVIKFTK